MVVRLSRPPTTWPCGTASRWQVTNKPAWFLLPLSDGSLNATCYNTIEGTSPDTFIVKHTDLAPVRVDVPFRYSKTVQPSSVVLGGNIN